MWKRKALTEIDGKFHISPERATSLARDFWRTNSHKSTMPTSSFTEHLHKTLTASRPRAEQVSSIPEDLVNILINSFSLTTELKTTAFIHTQQLFDWCSDTKEDIMFGSLGNSEDFSLEGRNSLFVRRSSSEDELKYFTVIKDSLTSTSPTRCLLIGPTSAFSSISNRQEVLELVRVSSNFPFLISTGFQEIRTAISNFSVSLVLALNRESCLIDPIDWNAFKKEFSNWATKHHLNFVIVEHSDLRFRERALPIHDPRSRQLTKSKPTNVYSLFSSTSTKSEHLEEMLSKGVPHHLIQLISKINKHQPLLSSLGILPNQLRVILKDITPYFDDAFEDISSTLLWYGYQIWKTRKKLMSKFWKEIAPEDWKPFSNKRVKIPHHQADCTNPSHFLKRYCKLSSQRPTPCGCCDIPWQPKTLASHDIRTYFRESKQFSVSSLGISSADRDFKNQDSYNTREDLIRGEHDRGKVLN